MTIPTGVKFGSPLHGTMLPRVPYTKDMKRLPALAVWPQAARPGNP